MAEGSLPSRRTVLRSGLGLAAGVGSLGVLPLFSTGNIRQDPTRCFAKDRSADNRLVISNWPGYMDKDKPKKGVKSTKTEFAEQFGIDLSYTDDVNDNIEFFAKVRNQLGSCESTKRDMFMLTDWMAARMIQLGWIQKLDASKVPNLHNNLIDSLANVGFDPKREYSAPWQSGLTGIAYNKTKTKEVRTFDELLTRSDLKGRISLLTEMRDTMGLIMLSQGTDPAKFDDTEWGNALDALAKAKQAGQIRSFGGNEYLQDLEAGNVIACEAWSGDIANSGNEDLVFVVPEDGAMIWADNMLIPNLATHQENAERWINYYYDPEVAAKLAAYVYYICPVKGAQEAIEKIDPSAVDNPLIFPTAESLKATHTFMALSEAQIREYEGDYADVTGG